LPQIPKINISATKVKIQHNPLSEIATAAEAVGLSVVEEAANSGLALLKCHQHGKV